MIVACPACSTGYLLPEHLVGPGGARIRCPSCQHLFAVDARGRPRMAESEPSAIAEPPTVEAAEPSAAPVARDGPLALAHDALERLAAREGEAFQRALAGRRLFSEYGPALMAAYDEVRAHVGAEVAPAAFRQALRERWGVSLVALGAAGDQGAER